eukprot:7065112-Pyramimonas_sp.AAC.1
MGGLSLPALRPLARGQCLRLGSYRVQQGPPIASYLDEGKAEEREVLLGGALGLARLEAAGAWAVLEVKGGGDLAEGDGDASHCLLGGHGDELLLLRLCQVHHLQERGEAQFDSGKRSEYTCASCV